VGTITGDAKLANNDNQPGGPGKTAERPPKKGTDQGRPLVEEVEEAMVDQDIPVETGIRPSTDKRPK
jgi:hypothetical protein